MDIESFNQSVHMCYDRHKHILHVCITQSNIVIYYTQTNQLFRLIGDSKLPFVVLSVRQNDVCCDRNHA